MDSSERSLVEAAQKDPAGFAALYDAHFGRIYAFIVRRVRDRHVAEDLTAEVFRHALAGIGKFEWRGVPFTAWLFRIAANEIADHAKSAARDGGSIDTEVPGKDEIDIVEQRASLYRHVDRLPADQRRVIVLRFVEERSIREIAADLGRSEGAIKQLQWRALQTLRAQMGPSHG
jgi:RNA polymerase sigma-70 factor, ECF subfamily